MLADLPLLPALDTLRLAERLIACASVTPRDAGCQSLIAERLGAIGFDCETFVFGPPDAAVTKVPGTTHFLPMERPYVVRDALRLLFEATLEGASNVDYVGAVRRTIDDSVGIMG